MRVLRRQLVARAAWHADHHRHLGLAAEHVADLRRVVDDLVVGDEREVDRHHLDHRSQAEHRRADGGADDDLFGDGRVDHALGAELVEQAVGDAIRAAELADVLADQEDGVVALHLLAQRFAKRDAVELLFTAISSGSSAELGTLFPLARVHVLVEVLGLRVGALVGELDDVLDLGVDLHANLLEVLLVGEPGLLELVLEGDDRVGLAPLLLVLLERYLSGSTTEWPLKR